MNQAQKQACEMAVSTACVVGGGAGGPSGRRERRAGAEGRRQRALSKDQPASIEGSSAEGPQTEPLTSELESSPAAVGAATDEASEDRFSEEAAHAMAKRVSLRLD